MLNVVANMNASASAGLITDDISASALLSEISVSLR